jgi:hypothetical protein
MIRGMIQSLYSIIQEGKDNGRAHKDMAEGLPINFWQESFV